MREDVVSDAPGKTAGAESRHARAILRPAAAARPPAATTSPVALVVERCSAHSPDGMADEILALERLGQSLRLFALEAPADPDADDTEAPWGTPFRHLPAATVRGAAAYLAAHVRLAAASPRRYLSGLRAALGRPGGLRDFAGAGWLADRLRRDGIRHIHAHSICRPADVAELASHLGLTYSVSARAGDTQRSTPQALHRRLGRARFTLACTDYNRGELARHAPGARIHRLHRGVDVGRFHPTLRDVPLRPALILAVGSLRERKGFDTLIEACRILRAHNLRFRCDIVGEGPEHEALERQIDEAGLFGLVVITGRLPKEAIIERYASATVLVQPSRIAHDGDREDIPRSLLEAMAMQVPVVATRVAGIPELVRDGDTGLVVPPAEPYPLAQAIRRLVEDGTLRRRLGKAARELVSADFDAECNMRRLRHLFATAAGSPSRGKAARPRFVPADSTGRMARPTP